MKPLAWHSILRGGRPSFTIYRWLSAGEWAGNDRRVKSDVLVARKMARDILLPIGACWAASAAFGGIA